MNSTEFNLDQLIDQARRGNATAFDTLMQYYRPYLRLLARLYVGRHLQPKLDASDLVQEAALQASQQFGTFRGRSEAEFTAWLRKTLANVAANARRHFGRQRRDVLAEREIDGYLDRSSVAIEKSLATTGSSPSEQAAKREGAVTIAAALERLPPEYRDVLVMREFESLSIAEIAAKMGRSPNSVQKLWARAISKLRILLNGRI